MGVVSLGVHLLEKCAGTMEKPSSSTLVCIDGSTLSSLLFKLKNSPGDVVSS